jgi:hypothetical protein
VSSIAEAIRTLELLTAAGFKWELPGYYSLRAGDVELALEPQVLNAGDFKLQLYDRRREPLLTLEVLVDVKPRPSSAPPRPGEPA